MGFKMKGPSMHSGTNSHRSALKKKASAVKQIGKKGLYMSDKSWEEGQAKSEEMSGKFEREGEYGLDIWVRERKKHKKGSDQYNRYQNAINEALGNKKRYPVTPNEEDKKEEEKVKEKTIQEKETVKGTKERADIITKEEDKMAKEGPQTVSFTESEGTGILGGDQSIASDELVYGPAYDAETKSIKSQQKEDKKKSKNKKKVAKATYGRKSKEYKKSKKSHKQLKADQERQRRQSKKDIKANKRNEKAEALRHASQMARKAGDTEKANKLNKKWRKAEDKAYDSAEKAEEFATKEDYKKTWWNPFD